MNYKHPNQANECFLAMEYIGFHLFKLMTPDILYDLLIRVLTEQNVIFVTDNIQQLTALVLGMYYLILPFKWPFIVIPNLPLDLIEVIESPVPFMIGLLVDKKKMHKYLTAQKEINANIVIVDKGNLKFKEKQPIAFKEPNLNNLKGNILQSLTKAQYYLANKMNDDYQSSCEQLYKNIYGIFKNELCDLIVRILKNENLGSQSSFEFTSETLAKYKNDSLGNEIANNSEIKDTNEDDYKKFIQHHFVKCQKKENFEFANAFVQTQIFASFVDDTLEQLKKSDDDE